MWKLIKVIVVAASVLGVEGTATYAWMWKSIRTGGVELKPTEPIPVQAVKHHTQFDRRWRDDVLGPSDETMRSAGCLVTILAANLQFIGVDVDPGTLNAQLSKHHAYTRGGRLIWYRFKQAFPDVDVTSRYVFSSRTVESDLARNRLPMVQIRHGMSRRPHWLLVVGADEKSFLVVDPARAEPGVVPLNRYGRIHAYRLVTRKSGP